MCLSDTWSGRCPPTLDAAPVRLNCEQIINRSRLIDMPVCYQRSVLPAWSWDVPLPGGPEGLSPDLGRWTSIGPEYNAPTLHHDFCPTSLRFSLAMSNRHAYEAIPRGDADDAGKVDVSRTNRGLSLLQRAS